MDSHKRGSLWGKIVAVLLITLMVAGGAAAKYNHYLDSNTKHVTITDDEYTVQLVTFEETVKDLLEKYDIVLRPEDEINKGLDEPLEKETHIEIIRAMPVRVSADGNEEEILLTGGTVADVLKKAGVTLREADITNIDPGEKVYPGAHIVVTRIDQEILIEKETISYEVVKRNNDKMDEGTSRVVEEGNEGVLKREILIVYRDGHEESREVVGEKVAVEPVNRIVEVGTAKKVVAPATSSQTAPSRGSDRNKSTSTESASASSEAKTIQASTTSGGDSSNAGKVVTFEATAYTSTGNRTSTGIWPKQGIISVDPNVIPLYSKVYVEFPSGWRHLDGYYKAMDTGGAIKGNKIDVFMDDLGTALQFGRRSVKVRFP